jgi:Flp pilus assembly protein TadD
MKKPNWEWAVASWLLLVLPLAFGQSPEPADAVTLQQQGKWSEAAAAWQAVIAKNPRDAEAYTGLGVVLSREQK